ncbi:hypothetical protein C1645_824004 [Glomus cerebriforme]|uniref:Uncharacterized protein n=1 Tax=Glomus cerebriforme TaxID=658196 RepID=A0A397SUZ5_9GLOM|nr:hypothetical protein C1645_824004 [Glomus cerebriforme]
MTDCYKEDSSSRAGRPWTKKSLKRKVQVKLMEFVKFHRVSLPAKKNKLCAVFEKNTRFYTSIIAVGSHVTANNYNSNVAETQETANRVNSNVIEPQETANGDNSNVIEPQETANRDNNNVKTRVSSPPTGETNLFLRQ